MKEKYTIYFFAYTFVFKPLLIQVKAWHLFSNMPFPGVMLIVINNDVIKQLNKSKD